MAKKSTPTVKSAVTAKGEVSKAPIQKSIPAQVSSPVRNSPIPKIAAVVKKEITHDQIAKRAFEIHCSGTGGSESDNWHRAERELRTV